MKGYILQEKMMTVMMVVVTAVMMTYPSQTMAGSIAV